MRCCKGICVAAFAALTVAAPPSQVPIRDGRISRDHTEKKRPLHGRFLHFTDFHPDRFYEVYASTAEEAACHRGQGPAGIYGAETSECDSPMSLINETMRWVEKEFKDKIDFVVWTGDSARHDNDEEIPRNAEQVIGSNEFMVQKMFEVFGKHNGDEEDEDPNNDYIVPIVPTFGNNDILPHNVMTAGPNSWTRTYTKLWRQFVPEAQRHQFEQGGWFYVEVIPNKLAVFSLNTLYFFTNNAAVDGCAAKSEPGYHQMEWLRIQLQFMRERGMKAILSGHVPPIREEAKTTWDETCWQKYTLWLRQYRDVIVGSVYGHFNYDHFLLQDFKDLDEDTKHGRRHYYHTEDDLSTGKDDSVHATVSNDYFLELRNVWSKIPKLPKSMRSLSALGNESDDREIARTQKPKHKQEQKRQQKAYLKKIGGHYAERYAASFVSASVVPNLYPTIRVFEYNTSGLDGFVDHTAEVPPPEQIGPVSHEDQQVLRKKNKHKFEVPDGPSKSAPPGPAYSAQTFSLLKYTQYFANITHINNDFPTLSAESSDFDEQKWKEGKHKGKKPHDKDHKPDPRKFKYQIHYDTQDDDVYKLKDLTMPSLVDLARRIGEFEAEDGDAGAEKKKKKKKKHRKGKAGEHSKRNAPWYTFIRRAFVETMNPEELEEEFGH